MFATAIITVTAAVFEWLLHGGSVCRNGFLCLTHSSRATPELNKPPPPRSPPGAGRPGNVPARTRPLLSHTRPALPRPCRCRPTGPWAWRRGGRLARHQDRASGKAPARVPSKPGRAAPQPGASGLPAGPSRKNPQAPQPTTRGAHRPQRPRGVTARWVGSQRPGKAPAQRRGGCFWEFLPLHVVPRASLRILLRRLQLAPRDRHCSPRTSPTSHLSAAATSNQRNNSTKAWAAAYPLPSAPPPGSSEDLCSVFSSARLAEGKRWAELGVSRGPPAPAPRRVPRLLALHRPAAAGLQRRLQRLAPLGLSLSAARISNSLFLPAWVSPSSKWKGRWCWILFSFVALFFCRPLHLIDLLIFWLLK